MSDKGKGATVEVEAPSPAEQGFSVKKDTRTIKLKFPILVENRRVQELEIPNVITCGDMEATDEAEGRWEAANMLIAHLAQIPLSSARQISMADMNGDLGEVVMAFLGNFQKTGDEQ